MRSRSPTSSPLRNFAEAPGAFLHATPGAQIFDRGRYHAVVVGGGRYVNASRLRFEPSEAREVLDDVHALAPTGTASWITSSHALATALRDEGAARRRAEAPETYARRRARPSGEWLAFLGGEPVAWAGALAGPVGLFLAGGATLPAARGRGAYRALVRARWDHAVELGTPMLVHAQDRSRRILEPCGFEVVCTMYELESSAR